MMHGYYASTDRVRLSEGDRRAARRRLRAHHRRGRIDGIELEERTDAVGFARNHGDLRTVFADLEPASRSFGPPLGPPFARRGWFPFFPVLPLLVVAAIVVAVTGHVPWVPLVILAVLLLVVAPWRRRRWAGYAC